MDIWDLHTHLSGVPGATPVERLGHLLAYADRMGIQRICVFMGATLARAASPRNSARCWGADIPDSDKRLILGENLRWCATKHHMRGIRLYPNYHGYALDDPGFARLLFGSHSPLFYFEAAALKLRESPLTAEQVEAIRVENARRLVPLSEVPPSVEERFP